MATVKRAHRYFIYLLTMLVSFCFSWLGRSSQTWAQSAKDTGSLDEPAVSSIASYADSKWLLAQNGGSSEGDDEGGSGHIPAQPTVGGSEEESEEVKFWQSVGKFFQFSPGEQAISQDGPAIIVNDECVFPKFRPLYKKLKEKFANGETLTDAEYAFMVYTFCYHSLLQRCEPQLEADEPERAAEIKHEASETQMQQAPSVKPTTKTRP